MLTVVIPAKEHYDEINNLFFETKEQKLLLEHSLIALSKWESKWKSPFLSKDKEHKTPEEMSYYIKCMTINQNVDDDIYEVLPPHILKEIVDYIDDSMTATILFEETPQQGGGRTHSEAVTSELIYYWMISFNIPFECQKWHLNRLLTLIKICGIKNKAQNNKKMSRAEVLNRNRMLNEQRKAQAKTRG